MDQKNDRNIDTIDLDKITKAIKSFFKNVFRLLLSIVFFYKSKLILFISLLIVGGILGFFLEKLFEYKNEYRQEIVIEPKYETTNYIYNFIESLPTNFQDEEFIKNINLNKELLKNLKEIEIEPVIQHEDILEAYKDFSSDQKADIHYIIEDLEFQKLENEKYRDFFKYHRLIFSYKNLNTENSQIPEAVFNYIKTNQFFKNKLELAMDQIRIELEQNQKSVSFINQYLENMTKNSSFPKEKTIVIGGEKEIPTVTSLLRQKDLLLEEILLDQRILILDKEIFSFVDYGSLITSRILLKNRLFIVIPVLLFFLVSSIFLFKYVINLMLIFLKEEKIS